MSARIKVMTEEQDKLLRELLNEEGIVLMTKDCAEKLAKEINITADELDGLFLGQYDYGGEADVWLDIVRHTEHLCIDYIKEYFGCKVVE